MGLKSVSVDLPLLEHDEGLGNTPLQVTFQLQSGKIVRFDLSSRGSRWCCGLDEIGGFSSGRKSLYEGFDELLSTENLKRFGPSLAQDLKEALNTGQVFFTIADFQGKALKLFQTLFPDSYKSFRNPNSGNTVYTFLI